jgi:predicted RNA binding protein YcfA (HicA-like mRNA interferase family)
MLEENGFVWQKGRGKGDHRIYKKGGITVSIPHPKKDLPLGTVHQILKMAGITLRKK